MKKEEVKSVNQPLWVITIVNETTEPIETEFLAAVSLDDETYGKISEYIAKGFGSPSDLASWIRNNLQTNLKPGEFTFMEIGLDRIFVGAKQMYLNAGIEEFVDNAESLDLKDSLKKGDRVYLWIDGDEADGVFSVPVDDMCRPFMLI